MPVLNERYQRYTDCSDALSECLHRLVEEARAEGWSYHEIATALINFAVDVTPESRSHSVEQPTADVLAH